MNRRDFLKTSAFGFSTLFFRKRKDKPNVLFIAIDDLNDWTGCLGGHPDTLTPNIDNLAKKGVLFTNAHCAAPLCNPSRAALMTGIRPNTSGVYYNDQPWRKSPILKNAITIPQHFRKNGYKVIGSGKIFHGQYPDPISWDEYWPSKIMQKPKDPMPQGRPLNGIPNTKHFDWGPVDVNIDQMGDMKVAKWVIRQLNKKHEKPVFLGCGFFRPHLPWYVPPKYFKRFPLDRIHLPEVKEDDLDDIPPIGIRFAKPWKDHKKVIKYKQWKKAVQAYLASINFMDECLGKVINALEKREDKDKWVVVLWADHGWHLGEKLHWRKFTLWEEATRNILVFIAPGITKKGGRCIEPVSLIDIYPTLIDLCDLTSNKKLEGKSLLPQLKDPAKEREEPALTTYGKGNHSLRSKHWRYIRYHDGTEELYDHRKDPMEWTNLASKKKFLEIKEKFRTYLPEIDAPPSPRKKKKRRRKV